MYYNIGDVFRFIQRRQRGRSLVEIHATLRAVVPHHARPVLWPGQRLGHSSAEHRRR